MPLALIAMVLYFRVLAAMEALSAMVLYFTLQVVKTYVSHDAVHQDIAAIKFYQLCYYTLKHGQPCYC